MKFTKVPKFMAAADDLPKIVQVALSCTTADHCLGAMSMVGLWCKFHKLQEIQSVALNAFSNNIILYLQDTREHAQRGYHKSSASGYRTQTTWPDINDYIAGIFGVKFPQTWVRGGNLAIRELTTEGK